MNQSLGLLWEQPNDLPVDDVFTSSWADTCTVRHAERWEIDYMIQDKHYLERWPAVVVCQLVLRAAGNRVGACVFAMPPRETAKRYGGTTWELARLWIDDDMPKNSESWFIARSLDHVREHHSGVEFVVSYADPSVGHSGAIYKATNFIQDGMTDDERDTPRFDYLVGGVKYSRLGHVPDGAEPERVPRVSKHRYYMPING